MPVRHCKRNWQVLKRLSGLLPTPEHFLMAEFGTMDLKRQQGRQGQPVVLLS